MELWGPDGEPSAELDAIAARIVDALYHVHREIGPGALESVYHIATAIALSNRGLPFERERWIGLDFEGVHVPRVGRVDFFVEGHVALEVKAMDSLLPVHFAQLQSYLRLTRAPLGFLMNFHVPALKSGLHRRINRPF